MSTPLLPLCRHPPRSGRVDLRQVEVTIQNLIGSGMDPKTENNPYLGFIYTSFQARAAGSPGAGGVLPWLHGRGMPAAGWPRLRAKRLHWPAWLPQQWPNPQRLIKLLPPSTRPQKERQQDESHKVENEPPPCPPVQERATKVSHGNTARMAVEYGDDILGKVCGAIASDESRHEIAYTRIVDEFFR